MDGHGERRPSDKPLGEFVIFKLAEPYLCLGQNIISDNFFVGKKVACKKTTLMGSLRANKGNLPDIAWAKKDNTSRYFTKLYKTDVYTLTIYKSKRY